jgi:sulfate adenylyltransferase
MELALNVRQYLELEKLSIGAFAPLKGFMNEEEFVSVSGKMRLPDGAPFALPVVLDVDAKTAAAAKIAGTLTLTCLGETVGELRVQDAFTCDKDKRAKEIFGVDDHAHPGVSHFHAMGTHFLGGPVKLLRRLAFDFSKHELTPEQTRAHFAKMGWKTISGFQTRNVPHRAHEYQQRMALSLTDGLFIQPLIGRKKRGDCRPEAILTAYRALVENFFPANRVLLGVLSTYMRYAGPREAVFHAIIRRNYGCTHFVIGRDHAGVGGYYGKYEAQELAARFDGQLGIEILALPGPFHCRLCGEIVTERVCRHAATRPDAVHEISGTDIRRILVERKAPAPEIMRPEVAASLANVPLFIEEDEK